jgi:dihydroorotase
MPNTLPPESRDSGPATADSWSIQSYRNDLLSAGADAFEQLIIPLYITRNTTAAMILEGKASGLLQACKYYPPHGTTNAEHGLPMDNLIGSDVLHTMEQEGVILCIHGEQHALSGPDYLDSRHSAESRFYQDKMPRLLQAHPQLRIVCEHVTSAVAADFVAAAPDHVAATITPQHLLFTIGHLIQGLKYHLYCLPIVKFQEDRSALRRQLRIPNQKKFFAGTDSAPHSNKVTECGCAAGCFTGGCAPQLYAMAFEEAGADLSQEADRNSFIQFLSLNGPQFYGFPPSPQTFQLQRSPSQTANLQTPTRPITPWIRRLSAGLALTTPWAAAHAQPAQMVEMQTQSM